MIRQGFRLVVMAQSEQTTDVPEHGLWTVPAKDDWRLTQGERERYDQPGGLGSQTPQQYWDRRARGMDDNPTTCAEENVLGIPGTRYFGENICVHEFVHSIMMYGLQFSDPALFREVEAAWAKAMDEGLWQSHYARTNAKEYFAEAAQTYFWSNYEFSDGDRRIQSPEDLKAYDPRVYDILTRVFPDNAHLLHASTVAPQPVLSPSPSPPSTPPGVHSTSRAPEGSRESITHETWLCRTDTRTTVFPWMRTMVGICGPGGGAVEAWGRSTGGSSGEIGSSYVELVAASIIRRAEEPGTAGDLPVLRLPPGTAI